MPRATHVDIPAGGVTLPGDLEFPHGARGLVLFAHGSGSSRRSPRNMLVARDFREQGLGTLLFDLLTTEEEGADLASRRYRFDIELLAERLAAATEWVARRRETPADLCLFGASTGAAAALVAAAALPDKVRAVVSRGGRPDLAGGALAFVRAPTLLIVGGEDVAVLELNRQALRKLRCDKELVVIPGATHLFEEPGALAAVAGHAARWFVGHCTHAEPAGDRHP